MPPTLMSVVINRSEAPSMGATESKLRSPTPKVKPRTYDDSPLPIQASDHAPRNAKIINRVFEGGVVTFELKIGDTVLREIGLEEVLDYVSPYHLEEYENEAFQREEELLRIAEEEDRRFKEEREARRKEMAKKKGVVIMSETDSDAGTGEMEVEVNIGKHGRARPSYKPMFMKFKQRKQRRKRDQKTGELIPLSEDDEAKDFEQQGSSSDDRFESKPEPSPVSLDNLPKRRRRKRDPYTGELLPLAPLASNQNDSAPSRSGTIERQSQANDTESVEKQKRPRRRRHPITKELMPLNWRYDPDEERRQAQNNDMKVSSMQRLSISHESEPKRRRLDRSSSSNERSRSTNMAAHPTSKSQRPSVAALSAFKRGEAISLHGSDSDDSALESIDVKPAAPKPKLLRRGVGGAAVVLKSQSPSESAEPPQHVMQSLPVRTSPRKVVSTHIPSDSSNSSMIPLQVDDDQSSSDEDEKEEEEVGARISRPPAGSVTSIMHPSAAVDESPSSEESEDEELPEDEYFVEAILAHALSNPATHPAHLGKEPVMLYKVKWEGWPDTTWEPETSFGDLEVVREYQQKVGIKVDTLVS